jgi:succinate dehydrogenase / fumarate reductase cytochrome b subunit
MNPGLLYPQSSIAKKAVMALTGLALFGFLITHFLGNLLLFAGPAMYNNYAHKLVSNPLIYGAEAFLLAVFLFHVFLAIKVTIENRKARPRDYLMTNALGKKTIASSTMLISGMIIFFFLIVHIKSFKFGADVAPASPEGVRDLYALVVFRFQNPGYSILYILCMAVLGFHLSHALQSAGRTFGLSHPKYVMALYCLSRTLGIAFAIGYSIFPIYFGFIK